MAGEAVQSVSSYIPSWVRTFDPSSTLDSNSYNPVEHGSAALKGPHPFEDNSWHPNAEPHPLQQSTELYETDKDKDICVCDECGKIFSNNNTLDIHAERTNHRAFGCKSEGCSHSFSSLASLHRHCEDHELGVFMPCPFCCKGIRKRLLRFHLSDSHGATEGLAEPDSGGYHCRHQDCAGFHRYHFFTEFAYFKHLQHIHRERLQFCDYPGCVRVGKRGFLTDEDMLNHQTTHTTFPTELLQNTVRSLAPLTAWTRYLLQMLSPMPGTKEIAASGKRRIFWNCKSCKTRLFDDFIEIKQGSLDELEMRLNSNSSNVAGNGTHPADTVGYNAGGNSSASVHTSTTSMSGSSSNTAQSSRVQSDTPAPISQLGVTESTATPTTSTPPKLAYLLCCIPRGKYGVYLYQEMLENILSDRALFEFLRSFYRQRRYKWYSSHPLRAINGLKLVRFLLTRSSFVDVQAHEHVCTGTSCSCLPPREKVEPMPTAQYDCQPVPPAHIPPIGENFLMHLFSSPSCIDPWQTWVFMQFPKRTRGKLKGELDTAVEGWGLLFREGWDWSVIWSIQLVFFVLPSIAFLIIWVTIKGDIQGASGVAAYWVAVGTIFLGYIATRDR